MSLVKREERRRGLQLMSPDVSSPGWRKGPLPTITLPSGHSASSAHFLVEKTELEEVRVNGLSLPASVAEPALRPRSPDLQGRFLSEMLKYTPKLVSLRVPEPSALRSPFLVFVGGSQVA